jgi:proteasome accessory factor C
MAGASTRLARLLALVPYLVARPGVPVDEVTGVFGVTERQLRADLDLLFMCGLPGYTPGDLIDVSYEGDRITVTNADAVARPLRVTIAEGIALLAAARTLAAEPGLVERDALDRAIVKLEVACAEGAPGLADRVRVTLEPGGPMLPVVEQALERRRRLHIRYHTASRDDVTERDVDPMRLLNVEGRWYLEAWCRRVEGVRLFRLDRVLAATELDLPAEVPAGAAYRDVEEGLFVPSPDDLLVTLD